MIVHSAKRSTCEGSRHCKELLLNLGDDGLSVSLRQSTGGGAVELVVEDDGVGRDPDQAPKGTGLGTRLVNSMAGSMGAEVSYQSRRPGTTARLIIPNPAE